MKDKKLLEMFINSQLSKKRKEEFVHYSNSSCRRDSASRNREGVKKV